MLNQVRLGFGVGKLDEPLNGDCGTANQVFDSISPSARWQSLPNRLRKPSAFRRARETSRIPL